jgi:hypothetical protein
VKLQLWSESLDGQPDELLGQVDVDDEFWENATACAGDAFELITDLATEVNGGV